MRGFSQFVVLAACSTASQMELAQAGGYNSSGGLSDPSYSRGVSSGVVSGGLADPTFNRAQPVVPDTVPTFSGSVAGISAGAGSPTFTNQPRPAGSSGRIAHAPNLAAFVGGSSVSPSSGSGGLADPTYVRSSVSDAPTVSGGLADPTYVRASVSDAPTVSGGLADPTYVRSSVSNAPTVSGGLADPTYVRSSVSNAPTVSGGLADPTYVRSSVSNAPTVSGGLADPTYVRSSVSNAPTVSGGLADPTYVRSSVSDVPTDSSVVPSYAGSSSVSNGSSGSPPEGVVAGGSRGPSVGLASAPLVFKSSSSISSQSPPIVPVGGARGASVGLASAPLVFKSSSSISSQSPPIVPVGGARGACHEGASAPLKFKTSTDTVVSSIGGAGGARGPAVQSAPLKFKSSATSDRIEIPMSMAGAVIQGPSIGSLRGSASYVPESDRIYEAQTQPSVFKSLYNKVFGTEPAGQRAFQNRLSKPDWSIH